MIKSQKKEGEFDAFLSVYLSVKTTEHHLFIDIKLQREDLNTSRLVDIVKKTIILFEDKGAKNFSKIQGKFKCIPTDKISNISFKRNGSDIKSQLLKTIKNLY